MHGCMYVCRGGNFASRCSGDEWVGTRSPLAAASHPIRSRSAAAGRSSGTGLGTVSMSLAEWKEQRRNSPPRHGSGQKNLLDDFTHVKVGGVALIGVGMRGQLLEERVV